MFFAGVLGLLLSAGLPALAAADASAPRVKYYLVAATANGQAETLPQIATRLLDSAERAEEIYELNAGRIQPDGGQLTRGEPLRVGWILILPWDAVGDGVRYGVLPTPTTTAPTSPATPTSTTPTSPTAPATTSTGRPPSTATAAPSAPSLSPQPSGTVEPTLPVPSSTAPVASECPSRPPFTAAANSWAQQQLAAQEAWRAAGRGSGVVVAVIDSGVDASVPQLSGRVSSGVNIVTGTGSGTTDCLGTGTAMAALIVADDAEGRLGVAPDATVVPVRVALDEAAAAPADQATAIDVAVSTGAKVVALGSYVDISLPEVRQSIINAANHDVVVVVAGPVSDDGSLPPQVLRVGALNSDGQLAQDYPEGTIDVVAPGQDVATLGVGEQGRVQVSGAQYAVALVAGAAALVRGAAPGLPAVQVAEQLRSTGTPIESAPTGDADPSGPSPAASAPLVNLANAVAVTATPPAHRLTAPSASPQSNNSTLLVTAAVLVLLSLVGGFLLLRRRGGLPAADAGHPDGIGADDWPPR